MDDRALERLFDEHGRRLVGLLLALLGRPEDAEDALQTLFVKLARAGAPGAGKEKAYLDQAARNEALTLLRRRKLERRAPPARLVPREGGRAEDVEAIEAALAKLPPEQAEVVVLKVYQEMTFAEIAALLEIPPETAASRWRYALEKLRRLLTAEDEVRG